MSKNKELQPNYKEPVVEARRSVEIVRPKSVLEQRDFALRELGGWLESIRENVWMHWPMKRFAALLLGVPLSSAAAELESASLFQETPAAVAMLDEEKKNQPSENINYETEVAEADIKFLREFTMELRAEHEASVSFIEEEAVHEARTPETDEFYLWELTQVAQSIEEGQAAPEYYARVGRPEWTPYQRSLFSNAPVQERFTELHPEFRNLSSEQFVDAYPAMLDLTLIEFRFSNQYRFLTQDVIEQFAESACDMEPQEALKRYDMLVPKIGKNVGLASVISLSDALASRLSPDHPVAERIAELGVEHFRPFVGRSRQNVLHMDQARGQLRVMRKVGDEYVLIDSFPAIGGPLNTPELDITGKPSGSEYVHVPDTVMEVSYVDRAKTSWSWQSSWVPQGAPIRESASGELQYQHSANKRWYDLTGANAEFFPDRNGNGIKPFDAKREPMDLGLIRAATHRSEEGNRIIAPTGWKKEDIIKRAGGTVPTEWRWNDFGSMAFRLKTLDGYRTNINIHSRPGEDMNDFIGGRTHGCFATFAEYLSSVVEIYGIGSGSEVLVTTQFAFDLNELK